MVGVGQARHQGRLDAAAVADDQRGSAVVHRLDGANPDGPMRSGDRGKPPAPLDEFGVPHIRLRPAPLLMEFHLPDT
jgi:hypothetical protein